MNPKTSLLALIALASSTVFAAGPAVAGSVQQRHHNGVKAHHNPIHRHNHKRGAMGKAAYCAAKTASIASVSAASTASVASVSTASEASVAAQSTKSVASVSSESKASTRYAATHTTAQPKPTPKDDDKKDDDNNNSGGGGGGAWTGTYTGQTTFYQIGTNSCGGFDTEPDLICALAIPRAQSYPGFTGNNNKNPICGQHITLRWKGRSVTVKVTDTCEGCAWNDVDLSKAAFSQLTGGQMELGRIDGVEWSMN